MGHYKHVMTFFTFLLPCIVTNFFIIKPTRCINFPNFLRHETLHVSDSSSAHHQEFIHCTLGTVIFHTGMKTAIEQDQDGTVMTSRVCITSYSVITRLELLRILDAFL